MSLHLEFEPHSWYKGFAIKKGGRKYHDRCGGDTSTANVASGYSRLCIDCDEDLFTFEVMTEPWLAVTNNGMTGYINEYEAYTLKELKQQITDYHKRNAERDAYNRKMIGEE